MKSMSQFSKKWIVLLVLVIPLVFASQARAHVPPELCDDGSAGRFYSECCECNLAREARECIGSDGQPYYKRGSCTHVNPAACSNWCEGTTPAPADPCNSSIACDSGCCTGIQHGYGATGYSRCTSLPSCSNDPDCGNLVWQSDVCRGTIAQGEYCRLCEGNYSTQVTQHLSGADCNASCDAISWMISSGNYSPVQIETITNHCYIAKVNGWADRGSYANSACLKVQRDAGQFRADGTWDYLCHHFDEGGHPWPDCAPSNTPTPTSTPTSTPTPVEIAISGRIYCQDPGHENPYPIQGAALGVSYVTDDFPTILNLQSDASGNFSTVLNNPDQGVGFKLKLFPLDASGQLSNGQPYTSMVGPTGNTITGCNFAPIDDLPTYACNIKLYNNLDFKYTNCEPQVIYPQCQDIEVRSIENPLGPAIAPDNLGEYVHQQVQFACLSSYPEVVSHYEFRVIKRNNNPSLSPEIIPLEVSDPTNPDYRNISSPYTINRGQYAVQCRICTEEGSSEEVCQPWDWEDGTIPWPDAPKPPKPQPTEVIPSPSSGAGACLPSDCGRREFVCLPTHSLQCQLDPLGECRWQCIPIFLL